MKIVEMAKAHPVMAGGVAIVAVIIFVMIVRGGGGGSSDPGMTAGSSSAVAAGTQLQLAQMGMATELASQANQLAAVKENSAMQLEMARIGATSQKELANIQANLMAMQIDSDGKNTALINTLQARVAEAGIAAEVTKSGHALAATQSTNQTFQNIIASQQATLQKQIAKQCSGFFDCLF